MILTPKSATVVALLLASALVIAGCRANEQGRVLRQAKGTYQGQADEPLDDAAKYQLRQRTSRQRAP